MLKDNKTSFKKSSITGNSEKKSRNDTLSQSVFGVKQGGFSFDEGKIQVSNVHGIEASVLLNAIEDTHHTSSFGKMENNGKKLSTASRC